MSNQQQKKPTMLNNSKKPSGKPNEQGTISVQAHMKIFDPKTKQVYVEGRA